MPIAGDREFSPPIEPTGFARVWRTLKQLFHEVIGGLFALLAFLWLNNALRAWTRDTARWLVGIAVGLGTLFVFFAWTSFRRARKL